MPRSSPRDKLLDAATRLFCRYGINATGINAVLAEAGTAKLTLYNQFESKEGLVAAVLEREGEKWRDWLNDLIEAHPGPPAERLLCVFDLLDEWFRRDDFYGCPFINAVGEHDKLSGRLRGIAQAHRRKVLDRLMDLARDAGADRPEVLCTQLMLLKDGAIVTALMNKRPDSAGAARNTAETLVDCHLNSGKVVAA